jgi:hypothetical protein
MNSYCSTFSIPPFLHLAVRVPLQDGWFAEGGQFSIITRPNIDQFSVIIITGITKTACMPIPPFLTFEDLRRAKEKDVGNRLPAVKIVKKACQRDKALEKRVFYENAVSLVGVDE